ncbi:MAG: nucleotidyl transferase AbiEii/AbiGii toxin family protein [Deltaproteobacteria bacterium]|nr:nucleotidyl transferase AbiEii/AbiGii toxin family protein [Deltaproteobacteria bacterium]MBI3293862.1 nucleotidyl transferase AbiEii/AbiGii toxin family protein [Deltaproteobacteria bacterium]
MSLHTDTQRREIFHFLFLEELLRISDPRIYVLKGGVNLRFFFKSPRYSEDMDLDVLAGGVATLKKNGYKILESKAFRRSIQAYGITDLSVNDPAKAKQTETTQRFRVRLVTDSGDTLPTKVEFSRRTKKPLPYLLEQIEPEIARRCNRRSYRCQHYSGETAVIQKIHALAWRDVTQARDVFDLSVLQSGGHLSRSSVQHAISPQVRREALLRLDSLSRNEFVGQVLEFLEEEERSRHQGKEAWNAMKETVAEVLRDEG